MLVFMSVFMCSYWFMSKPRGLPPINLPIVGSYWFLKKMQGQILHMKFLELSKMYGNIFGFWTGSYYVVILNGYKAIHQTFVQQSDIFSGRPNFLPGLSRNLKDGPGISFADCDHR